MEVTKNRWYKMKYTLLIAAFCAAMASNAKADYQLSVYVGGVLKYVAIYSTQSDCVKAGAVYESWSCDPLGG